jgi:hypothetical protein
VEQRLGKYSPRIRCSPENDFNFNIRHPRWYVHAEVLLIRVKYTFEIILSCKKTEENKHLRAQQIADNVKGKRALPVPTAASDTSFNMHSQKDGM